VCIPLENSEGTLSATPAGWLIKGKILEDYTAKASGRAHSHSAGALRTWQHHVDAAEICSATVAAFFQSRDPMQPLEPADARQLAQRLMPGAPATEVAFLLGAFAADGSGRCCSSTLSLVCMNEARLQTCMHVSWGAAYLVLAR
jgi:hypothetical protein